MSFNIYNSSVSALTKGIGASQIIPTSNIPMFNANHLQSTTIGDLSSVSNGSVLIWNTTTNEWIPGTGPTGSNSLRIDPIAIGINAGIGGQQTGCIAIGLNSASVGIQKAGSIAIGVNAGFNQQSGSVAIGVNAGSISQQENCVAIGIDAGSISQQIHAVAIGNKAGNTDQQINAIAIGHNAGSISQSINSIAIGLAAGNVEQQPYSIAIGRDAGRNTQGQDCIAIGQNAGSENQQNYGIAIGLVAGNSNQGTGAIAIGYNSGITNQGQYSINIGVDTHATTEGSIVLSAAGRTETTIVNTPGLYVRPIRFTDESTGAPSGNKRYALYDPDTFEFSYNSNASKTFVIQHPKKKDRYLVHACLEGPESGVYYRGKNIVKDGYCIIKLPEYTDEFYEFTIQITPVYNGTIRTLNVLEISPGCFSIHGEDGEFYWHVYGKRNDINVEPVKESIKIMGEGPYKYLG